MPAFSRRLERVADCRDLGIGEDHPRRQRPVGGLADALVAAEDVRGRDSGLVLAHVGEQGAAVDVADRVEPVLAADPHGVVDLDQAARLERDRLQPEVVRVRTPADRDEELGAGDAVPVGQLERDGALATADLDRFGARAHVDSRLAQRVGDQLAGERLLAHDHALEQLDERDL